MKPKRILLIEDDARSALSLQRVFQAHGYEVETVPDGAEGFGKATQSDHEVVITDLRLPGMGGLELVKKLHEARPRLPIILMTAFGTTETAIEATKHGAFEYLIKPFEMPELLQAVERAIQCSVLAAEPVKLGEDAPDSTAIIGHSRVMRDLYMEIGRIAPKPVTVLIRGETGTGKELVARAIYQHSQRSQMPFVAINCAAIPENLLESELFGHERGAFTGAENRRVGRFEQANGGTLFLDEIGDMTAFTQAKLLRVLQEKCIQRLGGKETIPVDVRVIAATHRDLEKAMTSAQFREDLYYRLCSVVIQLPPLRERTEDIPDLARYFLRRLRNELELPDATLEPEAITWLQAQSWPGNVRQLENVLRQALLSSRGFSITEPALRKAATPAAGEEKAEEGAIEEYIEALLRAARDGAGADVHQEVMRAVEKKLFGRAIQLAQGNQARAARWLNVSRQTMREKLGQFGLRASAGDA